VLTAFGMDDDFGSEQLEDLRASTIEDSLFQGLAAQASGVVLTPHQESYLEEYVAPNAHSLSTNDVRLQNQLPVNRTSGYIEQLHIPAGQNGWPPGPRPNADGLGAPARSSTEQPGDFDDGATDTPYDEARTPETEQDETYQNRQRRSPGNSDGSPTPGMQAKTMGRTMANSFKKSPTRRRVPVGAPARPTETKWS